MVAVTARPSRASANNSRKGRPRQGTASGRVATSHRDANPAYVGRPYRSPGPKDAGSTKSHQSRLWHRAVLPLARCRPIARTGPLIRRCSWMRRHRSWRAGFFYYLLWINGELASISASEENDSLPLVSAFRDAEKTLPHEDGFAILLEPFASSSAGIDAIDFSVMHPDYRPQPTFAKELSELFMWWPVAILFLWDTVPANCRGNLVYAKMYSLRLGMTSARVSRIAGTPEETIGEKDDYAVWVYRRTTVWTEGESITVSVGMRDKTAVWIRYYYDAADDYSRHTAIE